MCGRLVRERRFDEELSKFKAIAETPITARFNIGPMQRDLMLRTGADGTRRVLPSQWGLVPSWAKERRVGSRMFNARAETLLEKPSFRSLVARQRCVIPGSGFYEWQGEGKAKQPLYIRRRDGTPLFLAGLWSTWTDPETGESLTSHTIITTHANNFMAPIHSRMPVVLEGAALDAWLDPGMTDPAAAMALLQTCPDDTLTAYPVGPEVGNIRNDSPELIAQVGD